MQKRLTFGFDFDQTLANSEAGITDCLDHICRKFGVTKSQSHLEALATSGLSLNPMIKELVKMEEIDEAKEEFLRVYPVLGVQGTAAMPGANEILSSVRSNGHRIVIISAKTTANLVASVHYLGFKVDAVHGGAYAEEKASLIKKESAFMYIGDQEVDVRAAINAGALAVLVNAKNPNLRVSHHYFENLDTLHSSIFELIPN